MKTNPLKWQSQAKAYQALWADFRKLAARYRTVPTEIRQTASRMVAASRPPIIYALKIGTAISQDAFVELDHAYKVAQALADRYNIPVTVIDKHRPSSRFETMEKRKRR